MKKLFRILLICAFFISGFGGLADTVPSNPVYLPLMVQGGGGGAGTFTVSGTVKDVDQYPVANVTITDVSGAVAVTDIEGNYSFKVASGANTLTAIRSGYDIASLNINVSSNLTAVNFTAQVGCGSIVVNESLTVGMGGWDFLTDQSDVIPGTDTGVFRSDPSSGRVGINPGVDVNKASTTRARSQLYHIPSDADAVFLGLWVYQISTGVGEFDRQYIDLVNSNGTIVRNLYAANANTAAWTYLEFPLDDFIGDSVKIQVRALNSGGTGYATMYFDDVSLIICNTHCEDQIVNGGFEIQDPDPNISGWLYIPPQDVNPVYTTAYFHTGLWSMRTGIPSTDPDMEAFSEVFQRNIDLPSDHSGAMLTFWLNTTRTDGIVPPTGAPPVDSGPTSEVPSITGLGSPPLAVNATPEEDWFYVYVYDDEGDYLDKLMWEKTIDSKNTWLRYRFDLSDFMGQKIQLLFGTYNDGRGGPSAVYIDDVVLGTCD
jgi:hypothetical protein